MNSPDPMKVSNYLSINAAAEVLKVTTVTLKRWITTLGEHTVVNPNDRRQRLLSPEALERIRMAMESGGRKSLYLLEQEAEAAAREKAMAQEKAAAQEEYEFARMKAALALRMLERTPSTANVMPSEVVDSGMPDSLPKPVPGNASRSSDRAEVIHSWEALRQEELQLTRLLQSRAADEHERALACEQMGDLDAAAKARRRERDYLSQAQRLVELIGEAIGLEEALAQHEMESIRQRLELPRRKPTSDGTDGDSN